MKNFENWSSELEKVWNLKNDSDFDIFRDLMYSLKGTEDVEYLNKLIDSAKLQDDYGAYESLFNAIWVFPLEVVGEVLAKRLPEFQRRMGKYDQVFRFYLPIPTDPKILNAFLEEAKSWNTSDKRTAISAIKKWSVEDEEWETVLEKLGKPVSKTAEDPIPEEWNDSWKKRLENARKGSGEFCISDIVWRKGKKEWLEDLDFLIELLALNHGKNWRQIDTMTNPFWGFAYTTIYPTFIERFRLLPAEKQTKILENIKRVNKKKYKDLVEATNAS